MPKLAADENGVITEGRFRGRHVDEVMDYIDQLETLTTDQQPPSAGAEPPAKPKPAEELEKRGGQRVDAVSNLVAASALRQEQDDEEAFAPTVADYEEYREKIATMKKTMSPALRIQRGAHRQMYLFLKAQDPKVQARMLGQQAAAEEVDDATELPEEEADGGGTDHQEAPPVKPAAVSQKPPVKPRAVAAPTPASRTTPPKPKEGESKLKANERVQRMAAAAGMSTPEYLRRLEANGVTQDQLDSPRNTSAPQTGRRKTVFDNVFD